MNVLTAVVAVVALAAFIWMAHTFISDLLELQRLRSRRRR